MNPVQRHDRLLSAFEERFGRPPQALGRAPGRINLIGEHIDYNGFSVLPMAIDREITAAFCPRRDRAISIESLDVSGSRSFAIGESIRPFAPGDWGNYIKASAEGLAREYGAASLRGADVLIAGDIPASAGLSSSSALVVLAAVVILEGSRIAYSPMELAALLAEAERYVGTQGGGMDQAACLLGQPGSAMRVAFDPLTATPVALPTEYTFVVANSLKKAAKSETSAYNVRSVECRIATALIGRAMGRELDRLADIGCDAAALDAVRTSLHPEPYTIGELSGVLGDQLGDVLRQRDGAPLPEPTGGFAPRSRAEHVIREAARVEEACTALALGDVSRMGLLMNSSHDSCRELFEISCAELDRLTEIARSAGALGSRLTGAGFGGCTVSLVADGEVPRFLDTLAREYYRDECGLTEDDLSAHLFPARASAGAGIVQDLL